MFNSRYDEQGAKHKMSLPVEVFATTLVPDGVAWSSQQKQIILLELSVSWEESHVAATCARRYATSSSTPFLLGKVGRFNASSLKWARADTSAQQSQKCSERLVSTAKKPSRRGGGCRTRLCSVHTSYLQIANPLCGTRPRSAWQPTCSAPTTG